MKRADHLNGNPIVWTNLLADQLRWELCRKKADVEDGLAVVVVICIQPQISKEVVAQGLRDVASIQLKSEKHHTHPSTDSLVNLIQVSLGVLN